MKAFTGIPFFRILIPFCVGILTAIKCNIPFLPSVYFLSTFFALLSLAVLSLKKWKRVFLILSDILLFLLGLALVQLKDLRNEELYYGNYTGEDDKITFIAAVNDLPVEKEKFYKCELKLLELCSLDKSGKEYFHPVKGSIYAYFRRSQIAGALRAGQTLLVKARLQDIQPPKNPFEFDYRNYLYSKQIYATAFVDSLSFAELPVSSQIDPVWAMGLRCKEFVLSRLKHSGLTSTAYAICAALLTGYDDEIERPVMDAFSHSGTLHVLSVSGLHTGLIYLALNFILNFFDPQKKYKLSRFACITLCLWFFALITGFSAPVLRAVIMFNLLGFGKLYFRAGYRHQINILLVSAFILLLYNPFFITDIGFLLSYFALFGLMYFQPAFTALLKVENTFLNMIWQSITASFAATLSTLPITLFCFKQFPIWFFVCNLIVVPGTFIILGLAVLVVLKWNMISIVINALVKFLISFINLFDSDVFGFISNIHFTWLDVFFLSVLIVFFSLAFQYRSYRLVSFSLIVLITWQFLSIFQSYLLKSSSLLTVYNVKNKRAVAVKNKEIVALSPVPRSVYNFNLFPHINSFNYAELQQKDFNAVCAGKQCVLFLNRSGSWPKVDLKRVTSLVLSNNFELREADLEKMLNLRDLVVDASNNHFSLAKAEELSRNFGLNFYSTGYGGAYLLPLE